MANEATAACGGDPNFAVICSFLHRYGELLGVPDIPFTYLEKYLEDSRSVNKVLQDLFVKLLRRWKSSIQSDKWEKFLFKFCYSYSDVDAWELLEFGFPRIKLSTKLRALKNLLETQFDCNSKFKEKINEVGSVDLRVQPLGRDKDGLAYWILLDNEFNVRIYREEQDDEDAESWEMVVSTREDLATLIRNLEKKIPNKDGKLDDDDKSVVKSTTESEESQPGSVKPEVAEEERKPIKLTIRIKEEPPDPPPGGSTGPPSLFELKAEVKSELKTASELDPDVKESVETKDTARDAPENATEEAQTSKTKEVSSHKERAQSPSPVERVEDDEPVDRRVETTEPQQEPEVPKATVDASKQTEKSSDKEEKRKGEQTSSHRKGSENHCQSEEFGNVNNTEKEQTDDKETSQSRKDSELTNNQPGRLISEVKNTDVSLNSVQSETVENPSKDVCSILGNGPSPSVAKEQKGDTAVTGDEGKCLTGESTGPHVSGKSESKENCVAQTEQTIVRGGELETDQKKSEKPEQASHLSQETETSSKLSKSGKQCDTESPTKGDTSGESPHDEVRHEPSSNLVVDEAKKEELNLTSSEESMKGSLSVLPEKRAQETENTVQGDSSSNESDIDVVSNSSSADDIVNHSEEILATREVKAKEEHLESIKTEQETKTSEVDLLEPAEGRKVEKIKCKGGQIKTSPETQKDEASSVIEEDEEKLETKKEKAKLEEKKEEKKLKTTEDGDKLEAKEEEGKLERKEEELKTKEDEATSAAKEKEEKVKTKGETKSAAKEREAKLKSKPDSVKSAAKEREAKLKSKPDSVKSAAKEEDTKLKTKEGHPKLADAKEDNVKDDELETKKSDKVAKEKTTEQANSDADSAKVSEPATDKDGDDEPAGSSSQKVGSPGSKTTDSDNEPLSKRRDLSPARRKRGHPCKGEAAEKPRDQDAAEAVEEEVKAAPQKRKRGQLPEPEVSPEDEVKVKQRQARKRKESNSESEESESESEQDSDEPPSKKKRGRQLKKASSRNQAKKTPSDAESSESSEGSPKRPSGRGRGHGRGRARGRGRGGAKNAAGHRGKQKESKSEESDDSSDEPLKRKHTKVRSKKKKKNTNSSSDPGSESKPVKAIHAPSGRGRGRRKGLKKRESTDDDIPLASLRRSGRLSKGKRGALFTAGPDVSIKRKKKVPAESLAEEKRKRKKREEEQAAAAAAAAAEEELRRKKKKRKQARSPDEEWEPGNISRRPGRRKQKKHPDEECSSTEEDDFSFEEEEEESLKFSASEPELELESEGSEYEPQGRNAQRAAALKKKQAEQEAIEDDSPCSKCSRSEHPEWILLCDKCDAGFHTACLRPPLMIIPDGDWYCPTCEHAQLVQHLYEKLQDLDSLMKKNERLVKRKERLAYVGISLDNILQDSPDKNNALKMKYRYRKKIRYEESEDSISEDEDREDRTEDEDDDDEDDETEEEEDHWQTVKRSCRNRREISYRFTEYDDLINNAILGDVKELEVAVPTVPTVPPPTAPVTEEAEVAAPPVVSQKKPPSSVSQGKDMSTIMGSENGESKEEEGELASGRPSPIMQKIRGRKKGRRLTALDDATDGEEEDESESYKASEDSASDPSQEEPSDSLSSEEQDWKFNSRRSGRRRSAGHLIRRSVRTKRRGYKFDGFVVDNEYDSDSDAYRRSRRSAAKKNVSYCEDSNSDVQSRAEGRKTIRRQYSDSESSNSGPSRKRRSKISVKPKSKRRILQSDDSDDELMHRLHKRKPAKRYEDDSDFDPVGRRRAAKNINYKKMLGSDSDEEEEPKKRIKKKVLKSDSEYSAETDNYFEDEDEKEDEDKDKQPKKIVQKKRSGKVIDDDDEDEEEEDEEEEDEEEEKEKEEEEGSSDDAGGKGRLEQYRTKRPAVISRETTKLNGHNQPETEVTAESGQALQNGDLDIENLLLDAKPEVEVLSPPELEDEIAPLNDDDLTDVDDLVKYVTMD